MRRFALGLLLLTACPAEKPAAPDAGPRQSRLVRGIKTLEPRELIADAGPRLITFATPGGAQLWAVDPRALTEVRVAVRTGRGKHLAEALEHYPAVGPELLAKARAVSGPAAVSEQAEAALIGPLSLPSGGEHRPVDLGASGVGALLRGGTPECVTVTSQPGAVGRVLDGIGRTRVLLLLEGQDLARYRACVDAAPADGPAAAEWQRLRALLADGAAGRVAVVLALGDL